MACTGRRTHLNGRIFRHARLLTIRRGCNLLSGNAQRARNVLLGRSAFFNPRLRSTAFAGLFLAAQKPPGKTRGYVDWILALHRRFGVSRALVTHGSAVMDRVMMMVVMLQTSRPGGGAGKGV